VVPAAAAAAQAQAQAPEVSAVLEVSAVPQEVTMVEAALRQQRP
jgi:hypothetical protein